MKLGGSVITYKDQPMKENIDNIRRICREIAKAIQTKPLKLILGTGGGSFAHPVAKQYSVKDGLYLNENKGQVVPTSALAPSEGRYRPDAIKGFTLTQDAASEINRIVVHELLEQELRVVSMQPSAFCYCQNRQIKEVFLQPIRNILDLGVIPVVYGDVVTDVTKGCSIASTEMLLSLLATQLKGTRIIMCTDVDGVFDANPHTTPRAKLIPKITPATYPSLQKTITSSHTTDVTGGMLHKVQSLLELTKNGIESVIINGMTPGLILSTLLGEGTIGTVIEAG